MLARRGWGHERPCGPHYSVSWELERVMGAGGGWMMLSYRAWPELPGGPPEPVRAGMACPPDSEADRLGSSAELPDLPCVLTMFLCFSPPHSQGGPAHRTSAHSQWLLHHQRAGQERCVCTGLR